MGADTNKGKSATTVSEEDVPQPKHQVSNKYYLYHHDHGYNIEDVSTYRMRSSYSSEKECLISSFKKGHLRAGHLQGPFHYHHQSLIKLQSNLLGGRLRKINPQGELQTCCPKSGWSYQSIQGQQRDKRSRKPSPYLRKIVSVRYLHSDIVVVTLTIDDYDVYLMRN